jgi:hypothetical protein
VEAPVINQVLAVFSIFSLLYAFGAIQLDVWKPAEMWIGFSETYPKAKILVATNISFPHPST